MRKDEKKKKNTHSHRHDYSLVSKTHETTIVCENDKYIIQKYYI